MSGDAGEPVREAINEDVNRRQLVRAIVASTIGTAIEWYDFFLYGTAAALVFPKLFFPKSDPYVGALQAFATYTIGFIARPVGAAIFGHYGDRIGRKATLIATLLLMGIATFLIAFVPTYQSIGIWGAVILTVLRMIQGIGVGGEWGGSVLLAMEWARHHGHRGLVASWPQFGVPCGLFLSNLVILAFSAWSGDQFATWGWRIPFALSIVLVAVGLWIRLGILETPVFRQLLNKNRVERAPIVEVVKKQPREIILSALLRMSEQAPFYIFTAFIFAYAVGTAAYAARSNSYGGFGSVLRFVRQHSAVRAHLGPHPASENVPDRRGDDRFVRLSVFRHGRHRDTLGGVHRYRPVANPARYAIRTAGGVDRRSFYSEAALQWFFVGLSTGIGNCRWAGTADRHRALRALSDRLCDRDLHRRLRGGEPGIGGFHARLHRPRYLDGIRRLTAKTKGSECDGKAIWRGIRRWALPGYAPAL